MSPVCSSIASEGIVSNIYHSLKRLVNPRSTMALEPQKVSQDALETSAIKPKTPCKDAARSVPRQDSPNARDPRNFTSPIHDQEGWSWTNLPDILYQFKPDEKRDRRAEPSIKPYLIHGQQVADIEILPDNIASTVEEFRVEAWMRHDRRIRLRDITARMHPSFRIKENALQQRSVRFRQQFSLVAWDSGNKKSRRYEDMVLSKMKQMGIDPASNTTRGITPGLINPLLGEAGGRVPLPTQYKAERRDRAIRLSDVSAHEEISLVRASVEQDMAEATSPSLESEYPPLESVLRPIVPLDENDVLFAPFEHIGPYDCIHTLEATTPLREISVDLHPNITPEKHDIMDGLEVVMDTAFEPTHFKSAWFEHNIGDVAHALEENEPTAPDSGVIPHEPLPGSLAHPDTLIPQKPSKSLQARRIEKALGAQMKRKALKPIATKKIQKIKPKHLSPWKLVSGFCDDYCAAWKCPSPKCSPPYPWYTSSSDLLFSDLLSPSHGLYQELPEPGTILSIPFELEGAIFDGLFDKCSSKQRHPLNISDHDSPGFEIKNPEEIDIDEYF